MAIKLKSLEEVLREQVSPEVNDIVGYTITYTMFMIAQTHIWHLLCPNGQKHTALNEMYTGLQNEVDALAERFIANGGQLASRDNLSLTAFYSDIQVIKTVDDYRGFITSSIEFVQENAEWKSIEDGLIDLQEVIDGAMYKFNLQ